MPDMKNAAQITLSLLVAAGFFFCIFYMLRWGFPPENKDALNNLMGVLITIFTLQQNFWFGSTSSSKDKDTTISEIAKAAPISGTGNGTQAGLPKVEAVKDMTVKAEGDVTITSKEIPNEKVDTSTATLPAGMFDKA